MFPMQFIVRLKPLAFLLDPLAAPHTQKAQPLDTTGGHKVKKHELATLA